MFNVKLNIIKKIKSLASPKQTKRAATVAEAVPAPKRQSKFKRAFMKNAKLVVDSATAFAAPGFAPAPAPFPVPTIVIVVPAPVLPRPSSAVDTVKAPSISSTTSSSVPITPAKISGPKTRPPIPATFVSTIPFPRATSVAEEATSNNTLVDAKKEADAYLARAECAEAELARVKADLERVLSQAIEQADSDKERRGVQKKGRALERKKRALVNEKARLNKEKTLVATEKKVVDKAKKALVEQKEATERAIALLVREKAVVYKARKTLIEERASTERARALLAREQAVIYKARKALVQEKERCEHEKGLLAKERALVEKEKKALVQKREAFDSHVDEFNSHVAEFESDVKAVQAALVQKAEEVEKLYADCLQPFEEGKEAYRELEWQVRNCKTLAGRPIYGEGESDEALDHNPAVAKEADIFTPLPVRKSHASHNEDTHTRDRTVSQSSASSASSIFSDAYSTASSATTVYPTPPTTPTKSWMKKNDQEAAWP